MESCNRTQSTDRLWPYLLAAVFGTFLLAFVSGAAWTGETGAAFTAIFAIHLRCAATALLLLIVPSVWARLAHRISPWALFGLTVFAFACGWIVRGDAGSALYTTILIAVPGVALFGLQKLRLSNFRTVIYESFAILAALYAFVCLKDRIVSGDAYLGFKRLIALYAQMLNGIDFSLLGTNGELLSRTISEMIGLIRAYPETVLVPMLLIAAMTAGLTNTLFSHLFNRNGGVELAPLPRFELWRCERWYVVLCAVFLLVTLILGMSGVQAGDALSSVAGVLWRMPCLLAGLCTVRSLALQTGKKWIFWIAVAGLILLPTAGWMVLALIGALSALRKPMNVGEDGIRK